MADLPKGTLDELGWLLDATTPTPWELTEDGYAIRSGRRVVMSPACYPATFDIELIAAAVTALPLLMAALGTAEGERDELKAEVAAHQSRQHQKGNRMSLTPETLAELRRLLDAAKRRLSSPQRVGKTYAMETLRNAAGNALPALLDAAAERDALAAAVERVRALHGPRVVQVLGDTCSAEECDHEDACPLGDYTVCGHCYDVGYGAHPYAYEEGGLEDVAHPCPTIRALDESEVDK